MRLLSGIPSWLQVYFEKLMKKMGKPVGEIFPNLSVIVQGGVNFEPYREKFLSDIGRKVDFVELFPASEGFFAYQDTCFPEKGLLLNVNDGIFYEFVELSKWGEKDAFRLQLSEVEIGINYVLIVSSFAGLWAYDIGDTLMFLSKEPYRLKVTGRVEHFISAFGEHVIASEVENAMKDAIKAFNIKIIDFTVAPQITPEKQELPYHEWFIEFSESQQVDNLELAKYLDKKMQEQNIYYKDLLDGNILQTLKITPIRKNAFVEYMDSIGKLGGQNKIKRLSNDRKMAEKLQPFVLKDVF